jgi:hypothetical protein
MKASKVFTSVNPGKAHALSSRNMDGPMLLCLLTATENLNQSPDLSAINGTSKMKKTLLKITKIGFMSSMKSITDIETIMKVNSHTDHLTLTNLKNCSKFKTKFFS